MNPQKYIAFQIKRYQIMKIVYYVSAQLLRSG